MPIVIGREAQTVHNDTFTFAIHIKIDHKIYLSQTLSNPE